MFFNATKYVSTPNYSIAFMDTVKKNPTLLNIFDKAYILKQNSIPSDKLKKARLE